MAQSEAEAPGFNWAREEKRREVKFPGHTLEYHPPSSSEPPGVLSGGQEAVLSPYSDTSTQTPPFPGHTKQELPLSNPF